MLWLTSTSICRPLLKSEWVHGSWRNRQMQCWTHACQYCNIVFCSKHHMETRLLMELFEIKSTSKTFIQLIFDRFASMTTADHQSPRNDFPKTWSRRASQYVKLHNTPTVLNPSVALMGLVIGEEIDQNAETSLSTASVERKAGIVPWIAVCNKC